MIATLEQPLVGDKKADKASGGKVGRRGLKPSEDPATEPEKVYLQVLVLSAYKRKVQAAAERAGMDVSSYIRNALNLKMAKDALELGPLPE